MRRNALLTHPPRPEHGPQHRLGSLVEARVGRVFGHLGDMSNIHSGVFVSEHPVVAYAYAASRQRTGENDFGLTDVLDPPVLLGLQVPSEDLKLDTDVLVTATEMLRIAQMIREEREEYEDDDSYDRPSREHADEHARSEYYELSETGLRSLGGDIGNRANGYDLWDAAKQLAETMDEYEVAEDDDPEDMPDEVLVAALMATNGIVPQAKLSREVDSDELVAIVVIPPIMDPVEGEQDFPEADPSEELAPDGELNDVAIRDFDKYLITTGHILYLKPGASMQDINAWHGTSLSIARQAFPEEVTFEMFNQGVSFGSAYDLDALASEMEEEDDED